MIDWLTIELFLLYIVAVTSYLGFHFPKILGLFFMIGGGFFVLSGSLGLLRFQDIYSKIHAVGVTDVMGATMMITGVLLLDVWSVVSVKVLLIVVLLWIISPLTAHLLARFVLLKHQNKVPVSRVVDIDIHYQDNKHPKSEGQAASDVNMHKADKQSISNHKKKS